MNRLFITSFRIVTMVIFITLVPILFFYDFGTTLIWTILIPLLPIALLIIGFSRWRDICPLALISKISQNINLFPKRKVPVWFENNFWSFQYALLFIALTLRLTTLNYDMQLLGIFFTLVVLSAFFINLFYTGKSWCNFFCPVAPVEKIYTLSNAKYYEHNSACGICTACKKNCPDIDLESNYWKEGANRQKSFVFYSFAGMILGFYLYFYLQSGSFSYYFLGEWTQKEFSLLSNGFFFAPYIPVVIAAPLTLAFFSYMSYLLFKTIERILWKRKVFKNTNYETTAHRVKVIASFVAFNIFYIFAGAPSYEKYPLAYWFFYFFVVSLSSMLLYKEIFRQEAYFIQERFALKIIKRWNSTKAIPTNLKEIYYTYMNDNKNKKDRLRMYKLSIVELLQEGILNERTLKTVDKLREQLGVTDNDHERIMGQIKRQHGMLFDDSIEKSAETIFQENSYKEVIASALSEHLEINNTRLQSLQKQFCISNEVHKRIMSSLVNSNDHLQNDIINLLDTIHSLIKLHHSIYEDGTREVLFLKYSIKNEFTFASKDLFSILFTIYKDHHKTLKSLLNISKEKHVDDDFVLNETTLEFLDAKIAKKMLFIHKEFALNTNVTRENNNRDIIKTLLKSDSIQIAVAALLNTKLDTNTYLTDEILDRFYNIPDVEIQSLLYKLKYETSTITTYERMMYINYIPIFNNLKFDDLHMLGQCTNVISFIEDSYIIQQGDVGDTLYVLIKGAAVAEVNGEIKSTIGHRDYFGEIALLGDTKRRASIRVTSNITALTINKQDFKLFLEHNPKVSGKVIKEIIKKLT